MFMENPLFIVPIITAPFLILAGCMMLKWPPKKINSLYGYRTERSMRNQENWEFSQRYSAKKMIFWGFIYFISSGLGFFINLTEIAATGISLGLLILICFLIYKQVENALKQFEFEKS